MTPNDAFLNEATELLGPDSLLQGWAERLAYELDASALSPETPKWVALPKNQAQLQTLLQLCQKHTVAWVPRGAGTGQSGGALADDAELLIHTARLKALLELNPAERWACVEPGIGNQELNNALASYRLRFTPDPSSQSVCTLGGNAAENAGGIHGGKDGVSRDHLLGAELLTASGERLQLGGPYTTGSPFHWPDLYWGSEGTLGLFTKLWVKLSPVAKFTGLWQLGFSGIEAASIWITQLIQSGFQPSALELMDALTLHCLKQTFDLSFPEGTDTLVLLELQSSHPIEFEDQRHNLEAFFKSHPCLWKKWASTPETMAPLWQARRMAAASYGLLAPAFYVLDCVVPRPRLAEAYAQIQAISKDSQIPITNLFHAADGNLHPHLLFDPNVANISQRLHTTAEAIVQACLDLGGALSGEHGIGVEKRDWLGLSFQPEDLQRMEDLQNVLDPEGLCNPRKVIPKRGCCDAHRGQKRFNPKAPHSLKGISIRQLSTSGLWI
jgi:glycolate oxidase